MSNGKELEDVSPVVAGDGSVVSHHLVHPWDRSGWNPTEGDRPACSPTPQIPPLVAKHYTKKMIKSLYKKHESACSRQFTPVYACIPVIPVISKMSKGI